ncbi:MAG: DUF1587 domain-containing protein, partial [Betaproteobacteria bacterium]|nr:DUF1587 domain-containing protein [Betaproteobacteria bacterium]
HLPLLRVKGLLPEDGQQAGFDKVGGALDFSPVLVGKYLEAADVALNLALVKDRKKPQTKVWREPAAKQRTPSSRAIMAPPLAATLWRCVPR